jgi:TRAP-type transport system periplasmic protein
MKTLLLLSVTVVLIFALVISGCSTQTTTSTTSAPASTQAPVSTTQAQIIKLTFGSVFNATHPLEVFNQAWIDKIQKETNGRVQITLYPAQQLVKQFTAWDELKSGAADIAVVGVAGVAGFPIGHAMEQFMYGTDVYVALQIYNKLKTQFPEIGAEFTGAKPLQNRGLTSSYILTKKQVNTLSDLKGLQIQGSPSWPGLPEKLGATGVTVPFMEVYPSLQKGIISGTMLPVDILKSMNLVEVLSYGVNMHTAPPPETFTMMNMNSWNRLPPDIQKVFDDNIPWASDQMIKVLLKADQDALDFAKAKGFQFTELPQAELDKLYGYMNEISLAKAKEIDGQGLPGTKIYNELLRLKAELTKK